MVKFLNRIVGWFSRPPDTQLVLSPTLPIPGAVVPVQPRKRVYRPYYGTQPARGGTSRFKGVYWSRGESHWKANIWLGGRAKHLGSYKCEEEAARAFDRAALHHWGPTAYLNFPVADYVVTP